MFSELEKTSVFKGFTTPEIIKLLSTIHYRVHSYEPETIIAYASDKCEDLFILLEGHVRGEMNNYNDHNIVVSEIHAPDTFAEAFLFADKNKLLINIIANTKAKILIISKDELLRLLNKNTTLLSNYLNTTSNRFVIVSEKLKFLMFKTVRAKLAKFMLDMEKEYGLDSTFKLEKTHAELATLFGITRPALTRNILNIKHQGLIDINHKKVKILDRKNLSRLLD